MELTERRLGNVVKVWDAGEVFRFMVVISDPALAKRFMDAMTSMAKATP